MRKYPFLQVDAFTETPLGGNACAVLFDTDMGIGNIQAEVEEVTDLSVVVINSHSHYDHVGMTAFEELSRQWVLAQGQAGDLPFEVREVGSHWSRRVQVDVVAVNWTEHSILLGESKWGIGSVGRSVVRELIETKTPRC